MYFTHVYSSNKPEGASTNGGQPADVGSPVDKATTDERFAKWIEFMELVMKAKVTREDMAHLRGGDPSRVQKKLEAYLRRTVKKHVSKK